MTDREELDLGAVPTPEGYFLDRTVDPAPYRPGPDVDPLYRHRFTYRGSAESMRDAVVGLINNAKRKIFLASFRIGDPKIFAALFDAVDRLRGGVYVITALDERTLRRGLAELDGDADIDVAAQHKQFDRLTRRGIWLRGHEHCHAKFLVVDDDCALVGSANLETSALADQPDRRRAATGESGLVLTDPDAVQRLGRFFTRLWFTGCTWEAQPGAEYALHERTPAVAPVTVTEPTDAHGPIWTDGSEQGIVRTLHEVIGLARRELIIATFSLNGVRSHPDMLLDPLRRAIAEHRPDVRLLVRARNNVADHRADAAALAELGVTIAADSGTHAKGVIADGRHGALFSANLDAAHGLFGGVEMGVRLDGRPALAEARRYLSHVIDHADRRFEPAPTQRQLATGLHAAWQARWPRPTRCRVVADDADWAALTAATRTGPVLWEEDGHLRLYAGTQEFLLRRGADGPPRLDVRPAEVDARDRMVRWYDRRPANGKRIARGICPAIVERVPLPTAPSTER